MRTIKVKANGVVTVVSEDYFEKYSKEGWFIEVLPEPVEIKVLKVTKPKAEPKE